MEVVLFFILIAFGVLFSLPGSIIVFYLSYNALGKDLKTYQENIVKILIILSGLNIGIRILNILGLIRVLGGV